MCNYYVNFKEIAQSFNASLDEVYSAFNFSVEKIQHFIDDELLKFENDVLQVIGQGRFVVRNIAMVFDPLLAKKIGSYSKTV